MLKEALAGELEARGITVEDEAWSKLERLIELWLRYGRAMNLTGAGTAAALTEHVLDGLATVQCARKASAAEHPGPWLDVGTGGGFPGLVVAAVLQAPLTFVEPRAKRRSFLELALHAIGRADVVVKRSRIERSTWNENGADGGKAGERMRFGVASARAVWRPARWLEMGIKLVEEGGLVLIHLSGGAKGAELPRSEHTEESPKGRIVAIRATPALRERFSFASNQR